MKVRALRRIGKSEAVAQLARHPELAGNVSMASRQWGVSRATARTWIAMAEPLAPAATAMEAPPSPAETFKAALCHLADLIEATTPQEIIDGADNIELLGLHQDSQLVAAYVGAIEVMAGAAIKRASR